MILWPSMEMVSVLPMLILLIVLAPSIDKIRTFRRCGFQTHDNKERRIRQRRASRFIGFFRASPHAHGGALYSVTCSQRKYHYLRVCFMADSFAKTACGAGVVRSVLPACDPPSPVDFPGAPAARLRTNGTYLMALFSCQRKEKKNRADSASPRKRTDSVRSRRRAAYSIKSSSGSRYWNL